MIKYRLVDDPDNPGKKKKEIIYSDMIELDDLVAEIPGGFAMKETYKKIIYDFFETAFHVAQKEGRSVATPLINIKPTGRIDENGEYEIDVFPGDELQKAINNFKMVKVEGDPEPDPVKIHFVHDLLSDTTNKYITPGGIVEINGKFLKIRPYKKDGSHCESLTFHTLKTGKVINIGNILTNTVHKLVIELPEDMPEEDGNFVIITGMFNDDKKMRPQGKSKTLKVKRSG
jgi:hypothetical protein